MSHVKVLITTKQNVCTITYNLITIQIAISYHMHVSIALNLKRIPKSIVNVSSTKCNERFAGIRGILIQTKYKLFLSKTLHYE